MLKDKLRYYTTITHIHMKFEVCFHEKCQRKSTKIDEKSKRVFQKVMKIYLTWK